jgi:hypothetical protein
VQGTILKSRFLDDPKAIERFSIATDELLNSAEKEKLVSTYGLKSSDAETRYSGLLQLTSDLRFYLGVLKVAEGWSAHPTGKACRYHFHQVIPNKTNVPISWIAQITDLVCKAQSPRR